jgi:hypothetical protein
MQLTEPLLFQTNLSLQYRHYYNYYEMFPNFNGQIGRMNEEDNTTYINDTVK